MFWTRKPKAIRLHDCPDNLRVFICRHLFEQTRPIRLVVHDHGGNVSILCGEDDHSDDDGEYLIVGLGHLLHRDPCLNKLPPIPKGWEFERKTVDDAWQLVKIEDDD